MWRSVILMIYFDVGGLCCWKVSIADVWFWFHLCFWKLSMRMSVLLEVFDVEIRDLDMFRCGGLSLWMSLIVDVWFLLDCCFCKVPMRRFVVLKVCDVEI